MSEPLYIVDTVGEPFFATSEITTSVQKKERKKEMHIKNQQADLDEWFLWWACIRD